MSFTRISTEDGELYAEGTLTPSIPILAAPLTVQLRGRELGFALDYGPEQVSLPIPRTTIDDAWVSVFYSTTRGLGVGGDILYSIEGAGSGELGASVSTGGGVAFEGGFTFDPALFDRARVRAWWRDGRLGAEGTIGIDTPDKIRGIRSATASVRVDEGRWSFNGSAELSVPGLSQASIAIRQGEGGLELAGDVALATNPAIRSGTLHVECAQTDGEWKVAASGTAQPAIPGVDAELAVTYADGAFDARFSGAFRRGMLSGQLSVGATNRAVAAAGPGPEGAMTKLVLSELGHEAAAILTELNGLDSVFMDGPGGMSNLLVLMHRGMSIAGGTSEIKRNQIGERILGLPLAHQRQEFRDRTRRGVLGVQYASKHAARDCGHDHPVPALHGATSGAGTGNHSSSSAAWATRSFSAL